MDFLENGFICTEVLVSKRPKHYIYSRRNLTSIILHLLLPLLIAIGNTIEEHIGNNWEHKIIINLSSPHPQILIQALPTASSAGSWTACKINS
jgi:hypothetical protein